MQMIIELQKKLKKALDKSRFEHTMGVMYTAGCMAMAFEYSVEKAMLAGLLHDCAKCISNEEKINLCKKYDVLITSAEWESPCLLHAKAGAILAEELYGIKDPEILHAIKVHTTGEPDMSLLDKIIYIADYIEPGRDKAPRLEYIRKLAYQDINLCMSEILYDTMCYLNSKKGIIDPTTELTYRFYEQYRTEV
ncbi:MAG: bis(5'-nucleosyl)-tetraphosphatase (symmetrical) YqeK [Lachnospiraceae bacterium]|nr:bis(5'-nucleosyl)-tetraphosphatase (symmetrical) YqeK [Lachnospiraceae bacterium]